MKFGAHISIAGGINKSFSKAKEIGCDTFQIFTRNPRSWKYKLLTDEVISEFKHNLKQYKIKPIYSHMPYLPNLASPDKDIRDKSISSIKIELERCDSLNIPYIVTHLGSSKGEKKEIGIANVIKTLDVVLEHYNGKCKILLENTAGKNQRLGSSIIDICYILTKVEFRDRLGLCLDTCHAFTSGYDLRQENVIELILSEIGECVGLDKLKLIHCNDALAVLGSGIDRHEHIGLGKIGDIGFINMLKDKRVRKIPFICETPVDERRKDKDNLEYLRFLLKKSKN
ncbi:MAG: deoxyribonuclease IV [Asgard group archaeon]|nr:deoxyribonuclease IV [Asgard group archaeon]